jgi:hypothetical protein
LSARELQRVAVRMLYDEAFLERVYTDVVSATSDCHLTDEERSWLRTPDRRAWKVDPLRRSRSLAALVEEFAVSVALFVRSMPAATAQLDAFFSSEAFHRGMQCGDSLAAIFAGWFREQLVGPSRDVLAIEASLARVRRIHEAGAAGGFAAVEVGEEATIRLAPGVEILEVAAGIAEGFGASLTALRVRPLAEAAVDRNFDVPIPEAGVGRTGLLVDGRGAQPRLEILSVELARVLRAAAAPIAVAEFIERAAEHEADAEDCLGLLASFAEDGTIQAVG